MQPSIHSSSNETTEPHANADPGAHHERVVGRTTIGWRPTAEAR